MNDHQYIEWTHKVYGTNLTPRQRKRISKKWRKRYVKSKERK